MLAEAVTTGRYFSMSRLIPWKTPRSSRSLRSKQRTLSSAGMVAFLATVKNCTHPGPLPSDGRGGRFATRSGSLSSLSQSRFKKLRRFNSDNSGSRRDDSKEENVRNVVYRLLTVLFTPLAGSVAGSEHGAEGFAIGPGEVKFEQQHHDARTDHLRGGRDVKGEDADDDGREKSQGERHEPIDEQHEGDEDFRSRDDLHVAASHQAHADGDHGFRKIFRGGHEIQKSIEAKDEKGQAKKDARDVGEKACEGFFLCGGGSGVGVHMIFLCVWIVAERRALSLLILTHRPWRQR